MNVVNAVALGKWIDANRGWLTSTERGTISDCINRASKECGFNIPEGAMVELLNSLGIATRRRSRGASTLGSQVKELIKRSDKLDRQVDRLTTENRDLRIAVANVICKPTA